METRKTIGVWGRIGGTCQIGDMSSGRTNREVKTFKVTGIATEKDFVQYHPEYADPAFAKIMFENYYWIEFQVISSANIR